MERPKSAVGRKHQSPPDPAMTPYPAEQPLVQIAANGGSEPYLTEVLAQFRTASRYMPNGRLSRIINTIDALTAAAISEGVAPAKASVAT